MRKYIRHPLDIPITYKLEDVASQSREYLENISEGGLSFHSKISIKKGSLILIQIPTIKPKFMAKAEVVWCRKTGEDYDVGVKFLDQETEFRARMVEQVCHIEHYRKKVLEEEGRKLSTEEAAIEWIDKFAKHFPAIDEDDE